MRVFCLILALLMLAGCAPALQQADAPTFSPPVPGPEPPPVENELDRELRLLGERIKEASPQEVVEAYLELQYLGYIHMEPVDMGMVLDLFFYNMHNLDIWQGHLAQRRRLIDEMGLAYVEKEKLPYKIRYLEPEEITDGRLERWEDWDFGDDAEVTLHFVVEGEESGGYPPLLAVGGQQTVRLRREGESFRITFLYFPGAARKFYTRQYMDVADEEEVRARLLQEFDGTGISHDAEQLFSLGGRPYDPSLAAAYASAFALSPNPDFYHAGDWAGNCMNFVSQSVLHGFGDGRLPIPNGEYFSYMSDSWYGGEGGGVPAWENVDYFWDFATGREGPMTGRVLASASELGLGDVIQTQPIYRREEDDPDDYAHALVVVEEGTLLLAQNSPSNFIYYSDLVDVNFRYYRPQALIIAGK